jgi:hypothetical protein
MLINQSFLSLLSPKTAFQWMFLLSPAHLMFPSLYGHQHHPFLLSFPFHVTERILSFMCIYGHPTPHIHADRRREVYSRISFISFARISNSTAANSRHLPQIQCSWAARKTVKVYVSPFNPFNAIQISGMSDVGMLFDGQDPLWRSMDAKELHTFCLSNRSLWERGDLGSFLVRHGTPSCPFSSTQLFLCPFLKQ